MGRMFIIGLNILGFAWSVGLAALKCSVASLCGQFTGFNFPLLNRTILPLFTGSYGSNDPTLCVTLGSNLQIHCTLVSSDMVEVPLQSSGCTSIGLRSCNSTGFATEQMVSYFLTTRDTPPDFLSTLRIVNPIFGVIKNDSFAVELSPHLEDIDGICLTITEIGEFLVAPNSLSIHALQDGATEPGSWFFEVKPVRKQVNGRQLYGLSSIGYVELIPSTEVFFSERDFHSNGRSDRIEDVDNEMAVWEQNIFQHFSEVTNVARTDKNSLIDICIWTSSVMDGQKRIWLQQAEFLDHSKFSFAWIISLLGNHTVAEAMRSPLDFLLKGSLIAALLEIPDSVMVDSPFNMLSLPVATIADSPAGIDVQLSTSLLESNQSVLFEYVRQRLVIANGTIELTSPPWCRRILEAVKEVLTSLQCDILVYGNNRGFSSDVLITDVARALGIPTVTELLNLFIHPYVMPDVVVAPSHYALNHKSIQTSLLEAKVLPATGVICPAVDFNHFYPRPTSPLVRKDIVMPALIKIGFVARVSVGEKLR